MIKAQTSIQDPANIKTVECNRRIASGETAFGCPRDFHQSRFVYTVISPRARGLSIGLNLNPDKYCNFDCAYCEVNRAERELDAKIDPSVMVQELAQMLETVHSGRIRERPFYRSLPDHLLELRHVALSGDGEPTLCPWFAEVVEAVIHLRARERSPFFKLVLITNASGLDLPQVQAGVRLFSMRDEIWAKLDGGTQEYLNGLNHPDCSIDKLLANILWLGRQRPIIIQSLFPSINGQSPPAPEIDAYAERLAELRQAGANIAYVQIYSATRPTPHSECGHLPLRILSAIAKRVREVSGLNAEIF